MKSILFFSILIWGQISLSQELTPRIELQPGTALELIAYQKTVVVCAPTIIVPTDQQIPGCSIKNQSGYYYIYAGKDSIDYKSTIDSAIEIVKDLKVAGICGTDPLTISRCSIKSQYGYYYVYTGSDQISYYSTLQSATDLIIRLRSVGVCK